MPSREATSGPITEDPLFGHYPNMANEQVEKEL